MYKLTKCGSEEIILYTDNNLSIYINKVVKLTNELYDGCYLVEELVDGEEVNSQTIDIFVNNNFIYNDCVTCVATIIDDTYVGTEVTLNEVIRNNTCFTKNGGDCSQSTTFNSINTTPVGNIIGPAANGTVDTYFLSNYNSNNFDSKPFNNSNLIYTIKDVQNVLNDPNFNGNTNDLNNHYLNDGVTHVFLLKLNKSSLTVYDNNGNGDKLFCSGVVTPSLDILNSNEIYTILKSNYTLDTTENPYSQDLTNEIITVPDNNTQIVNDFSLQNFLINTNFPFTIMNNITYKEQLEQLINLNNVVDIKNNSVHLNYVNSVDGNLSDGYLIGVRLV